MSDVTVSDVARRVDVSPGTLRRWVRDGIVTLPAGACTPAAIAHARMVARLLAYSYRDGDYYGRAVNLAARVGARAAGGEVLVTREVVEAAGRRRAFERIGEVKLKGFDEATERHLARRP
jgi:adenylate cyclase